MQFANCKIVFAGLLLIVVSVCMLGGAGAARAASLSLDELQIGDTITLGGINYIKVNTANLLVANSNYACPNGMMIAGLKVMCVDEQVDDTYVTYGCTNPIGTMQTWDGCDQLALPTYGTTDFTQGPCLLDARDGKTYEIRKFADGKCWMVTNLAYGGNTAVGDSDGCINVGTGYTGASSVATATTNRFGANTYGNCRAAWTSGGIVNDVNMYGYLYDWAAAVQDKAAYRGNTSQSSMSYAADGSTLRQGICPSGWHLPTSNELTALHNAAGSPTTGFYQGSWSDSVRNGGTYTGGNWRGVYAGWANSYVGDVADLGYQGCYWSSTWYDQDWAYVTYFKPGEAAASYYNTAQKYHGRSVRCIRD